MTEISGTVQFRFYDYLKKLLHLIIKDRIPARATSLAYTTILAMVPLAAVFISFGSRELLEGPLKKIILTTILPESQEMILDWITSFAENSRKLGTWGLVITVTVVFLLINKIEIDLNALLRARPNRNLLTRAGIYFGILIFGTFTIGSSFTITNDLIELMTLKLPQEYSLLETVLTSLVSIFLIGLTIFLLMTLVSSAKIQLRSALWGAFWGAIFWETAKKGFSLWAHYSIRVSVIYGSFFLIPLLFIWIQLAWIIILSSLEIAYFHQHPDYLLLMEENKRAPSFQALMTIELFQQIKMEWDIKNSSVPLEHLADGTGLPEEEILHLVNRLKRYKLVNGDDRKGYIPVKESVEEEKLMYAALDRDGVNNQKSLHRNVIEIWNRFLELLAKL